MLSFPENNMPLNGRGNMSSHLCIEFKIHIAYIQHSTDNWYFNRDDINEVIMCILQNKMPSV